MKIKISGKLEEHLNIKMHKNINLSKIEHFVHVKLNNRKEAQKRIFHANSKLQKILQIYHIRKCKNIVNKIKVGNKNSISFVLLVSGMKVIRPVTEIVYKHKRKYIH